MSDTGPVQAEPVSGPYTGPGGLQARILQCERSVVSRALPQAPIWCLSGVCAVVLAVCVCEGSQPQARILRCECSVVSRAPRLLSQHESLLSHEYHT